MANKTATLKNQAGDNIYPNIVGDNRNTAIKDSTTIKHTLAENKISLDLDEAIKGKIDAALQKPTGLTKTKLVGVGAQGQENIEIGDNLTLANGKLSATGGGSGESIPIIEGTVNEDGTITLASAPSANFILYIASANAYIYMANIGNLYYGSFIAEELNGNISINVISSKEDSPTILNLTISDFNPNNIPNIDVNLNNVINMVVTHGVDNIDFSNELKTRFLYVIDTKSPQSKIYPLYYIHENEYKGFGMFMYNNMTFLETYTLSIKNNIGTITTVTDGFKTYRLFDEYPILVPKDSADANILPLPSDASTSTYVLKAVNGTVQWVKEA